MYIVEGNIGAGKSTFLKLLESHLQEVTVALEPLAHWQDSKHGQSLLANFYQQPKRWAYTLETLIMMSRVRDHQTHSYYAEPFGSALLHSGVNALRNRAEPALNEVEGKNGQLNRSKNIIMERSIYSGHHCFAQNSYANGFMSSVEWHMYSQLYNFLIPNTCKTPLGFIYLKVDPEIAYGRIQKRNRTEEKTITLEYLRQIDERHESFLINDKKTLPYISITPVLTLDCNEEFELNHTKLHEHITKVKQFIANTQNTFMPAKSDWQMLRRAPIVDDELHNI